MHAKVIFITGVSSGFGRAIAEALSERGHIVYGTKRRSTVDTLSTEIHLLTLDVTDPVSIEKAVAQTIAEQGRIDVLINNAGMGIGGAVELATDDEMALQMNTNFWGVVNLCRAVLPHMRRRRQGRIINLSSIGGVFAIPYQGFYSASKFAVEGYSEALSLETKQFGIDVVMVEPGDFNTGFTANRVISQATQSDSDYQASFARVLTSIEKDESTGGSSDYLARKMVGIVERRRTKLRYVITKDPLQRLSVCLSKLLPGRWFQALLRLFYNMR